MKWKYRSTRTTRCVYFYVEKKYLISGSVMGKSYGFC